MTDAALDAQSGIDAILAEIRAELGQAEVLAPAENRRVMSVVRVEDLQPVDEGFPSDRKNFSTGDFETLDEQAFLQAAYRAVLGREMDESGRDAYLPALRQGHITPVEVLRILRASAEGQAHGANIAGLERRFDLDRLTGAPILGGVLARLKRYATLPQLTRRLFKRVAATDLRHRNMVSGVNASLSSVRRSLQKLEQRLVENEQRADEAAAFAQTLQDSREHALSELKAARSLLGEQARQLSILIDAARAKLPKSDVGLQDLEAIPDTALDGLYLAFENRFRGSTQEISERQKRYLRLFRNCEPVIAGKSVLDIGCGRGEFLALLRDANIAGRGVDLNSAMAAQAREQGLDVVDGDAIALMRAALPESLGAVTGFHIVEHLAFRDLVALFDAAHAALAPGGFVLFETPNPENLVVGACTFHYDPTHQRPLPPDFLRFIAEARGFGEVRIIRRDEDCRLDQPETGFSPQEVNDWFRQPADYAVFARKTSERAVV